MKTPSESTSPASPAAVVAARCDEPVCNFIDSLVDLHARDLAVVTAANCATLCAQIAEPFQSIINLGALNHSPDWNDLLACTNQYLKPSGILIGCLETLEQRKRRIYQKYPGGLGKIVYTLDFIFERVLPKLPISGPLYARTAGDRNRALSFTEALGRLVFSGFEITASYQSADLTYFAARKVSAPSEVPPPSSGPLFTMRRRGRGGQIIHVYKFRTMHPYAQFLQAYAYQLNGLQDGIKIHNDFRITSWGRFLRKTWLDELPMLINLMRGDLKWIGPRPLSEQRLSLYPQEVIELRQRYKPGLLPPYYADLPKTLEGVIESERQYLEAYQHSPRRTDWRYFWKIVGNITIKRARGM